MLVDDYSHSSPNIFYVSDNICGPDSDDEESLKIFNDFNSQIESYCSCSGKCRLKYCICFKSVYHVDENLLSSSIQTPVFECNDNCSCTEQCANRVVSKGPVLGLLIRNCENSEKGLGLFTKHTLTKNTFICTYAGEVITRKEAERRHRYNALNNKTNYIFCLKEHCNGTVTETIVDPSVFGNIGRYINHSCQPNSIITPVRIDSPIPKFAIFSCVDIPEGTEITFDYGINSIPSNNKDDLKKCFCQSDLCRKWMPYELY